MRHQPPGIGRITMEPAAKLIVDSTFGHLLTSLADNLDRFGITCAIEAAQQELQGHRRGKLRCTSKTAVDGIIALHDSAIGSIQKIRAKYFARFDARVRAPHFAEQ